MHHFYDVINWFRFRPFVIINLDQLRQTVVSRIKNIGCGVQSLAHDWCGVQSQWPNDEQAFMNQIVIDN